MKILLLPILMLMVNLAFGKSRDVVTTRLMSTSGAGVGSILLNESAVLNPASITYFNNTSFYYQKLESELSSESNDRSRGYQPGYEESFIVADTSSAVKGTFSYHHNRENQVRTKRYAAALAGQIGEKTAMGFLLQYYNEEFPYEDEQTRYRGDIGISHVYSNKVSLGAVLQDVTEEEEEDHFFIAGTQVEISDHFHLILDAGFSPNSSLEKTALTRFGAQVNILDDFFIRAGQFQEKATKLKGTSWGVSWVGPKLSLDYAYRRSTSTDAQSAFFKDEVLEEHSFGVGVRF